MYKSIIGGLSTALTKVKLYYRGIMNDTPNRKLTWTVKDFQTAKKWAKSQPHPNKGDLTLWDYIYSTHSSSSEILAQINKRIKYDKIS